MYETKHSFEDLSSFDNIAAELDKDTLQKIGSLVVEGYDEDLDTRSEWEERFDKCMDLAMQTVEKKSFPWDDASNVKYPILTTAALQFSSRAYPALISGTQVVKAKVSGFDIDGDKHKAAIRVGKHMSYQILEEMENWEEEMDKLCIILPIVGSVFKKTYFSPSLGRNISELVYPKDFVVNYWTKDLETSPRQTHVLELSKNDIYERVAMDIYIDADVDTSVETIDSSEEERSGLEAPSDNDDSTPYVFLEQHRFLDLDDDGYAEPYVVTVNLDTKNVVRIVRRWDDDGVSLKEDGTVIQIKAVGYFTKFSFVPNPDGGFYDIGFGTLLGPINNTVNTLINQLVDSGTLNNLNAGFISRGIRIKGGRKAFELGEWKTVNSTSDDLRKGIVPLPTKEPSQVLFSLLSMMIESANKLGSVTDMLTGENPGQNQPATTTMAVIEQGLKVFSSIYKRMHRSLKKEFKKLYRLNRIYLPPESYFQVLDLGEEGAMSIFQNDYSVDVTNVQPSADPNVASESQRLMKVQALLELVEMGTINPQAVTRRILEAQEQPNIEELMNLPEQGPDEQLLLQQMMAQDESERGWAKLEIDAKTAEIKEFSAIEGANKAFDQLRQSKEEMKSGNNEGRVPTVEK
ncbi:MAG: hypothetical protein JKY96_04405 [Phycisphaerales bacterium]|nr:hypothetical protein [Phycisphaerales bacterium]